jgi:hypothetical protein
VAVVVEESVRQRGKAAEENLIGVRGGSGRGVSTTTRFYERVVKKKVPLKPRTSSGS